MTSKVPTKSLRLKDSFVFPDHQLKLGLVISLEHGSYITKQHSRIFEHLKDTVYFNLNDENSDSPISMKDKDLFAWLSNLNFVPVSDHDGYNGYMSLPSLVSNFKQKKKKNSVVLTMEVMGSTHRVQHSGRKNTVDIELTLSYLGGKHAKARTNTKKNP